MKLLRDLSPQLVLAGIVALQIACGDSSGPGATAATIAANSSTTQIGTPGTAVAEAPSVIVRDGTGNPIAGVRVTFAVTSGGGLVNGGNAVSNTLGIATVTSWTLGTTPGTNTLTATTGSLPSIVFTAEGGDPCNTSLPHALGSTSNGKLTASDCRLSDGTFIDFFDVNIPSAGTYLFTQNAAFDTYMLLLNSNGAFVGVNDDFGQFNTSVIKAILPAGTFIIGANGYLPADTGSYTVASASSTAPVTNCEDVFVLPGISSDQALEQTDCSASGIFSDDYIVFLQAGQTITITMTSSAVDSYLELYADSNPPTLLASNDNIDGTTQNARISYTVTGTAFYIIKARSAGSGATGTYTIAIQ